MDLSIVIVNYNTGPLLRENLESLEASPDGAGVEVVVVDNHSQDGSVDTVRSGFPDVKLIPNPRNEGFAAGVNQGVSASSGRYVLILNADTRLPADGWRGLVEFAEKEYQRCKAGIVGVRLLNADGSLQYSMGRFPTIPRTVADAFRPRDRRKCSFDGYARPGETDWVTGACLLVRREMLDEVGLFDENFFLYYEDVDLCWRAKNKGWAVVFYPGFEVHHRNPYHQRRELREFVPVEIRRSHLYFYRKNYSSLSFSTLWCLTLAYTATGWLSAKLPLPWRNGTHERAARVHRRILSEVLFNGRTNGTPHRPPDAD